MRNAPNWVIGVAAICITIVFLGTAGGFVFLSATGADATQFRAFLDTVFQFVTVLVSGGAFVAAGSAAKSAANAERQTNGELEPRIKRASKEAVTEVIEEMNGGSSDGRPTV